MVMALRFVARIGRNKMNEKLSRQISEMLVALKDLELSANSVQYCFDRRPENFGVALTQLEADAKRAREVIATVEGQQ